MTQQTLPENQQKALDYLAKYRGEWKAPGAIDIPWQTFDALHRKGLCDKLPESRERTVMYRVT